MEPCKSNFSGMRSHTFFMTANKAIMFAAQFRNAPLVSSRVLLTNANIRSAEPTPLCFPGATFFADADDECARTVKDLRHRPLKVKGAQFCNFIGVW